jgi:hypothetical protein
MKTQIGYCGGTYRKEPIYPLTHSQAQLNKIAREMSKRPRKTLEYETRAARFKLSVALTG